MRSYGLVFGLGPFITMVMITSQAKTYYKELGKIIVERRFPQWMKTNVMPSDGNMGDMIFPSGEGQNETFAIKLEEKNQRPRNWIPGDNQGRKKLSIQEPELSENMEQLHRQEIQIPEVRLGDQKTKEAVEQETKPNEQEIEIPKIIVDKQGIKELEEQGKKPIKQEIEELKEEEIKPHEPEVEKLKERETEEPEEFKEQEIKLTKEEKQLDEQKEEPAVIEKEPETKPNQNMEQPVEENKPVNKENQLVDDDIPTLSITDLMSEPTTKSQNMANVNEKTNTAKVSMTLRVNNIKKKPGNKTVVPRGPPKETQKKESSQLSSTKATQSRVSNLKKNLNLSHLQTFGKPPPKKEAPKDTVPLEEKESTGNLSTTKKLSSKRKGKRKLPTRKVFKQSTSVTNDN